MRSTGSCCAGCGFPQAYLKAESNGQILHLALEISSEELTGLLVHAVRFSPSVADVILMRFSILHNCFMILSYEKQTSKTKHNPSGLMLLAFNQELMTDTFVEVVSSHLLLMCCCLLQWMYTMCHTASYCCLVSPSDCRNCPSSPALCTSLHWLVFALVHKGPILIPHSLFCKDLAVPGGYSLGPV